MLWKFCQIVKIVPSEKYRMSVFVLNLETLIHNTIYLGTETGKLCFAKIFTIHKQLFVVIYLN